jgi:hypothetical protein
VKKYLLLILFTLLTSNLFAFNYNMTKDIIAYSTPTQINQGSFLNDLDYGTTFWRVSTATDTSQANFTTAVPVYSRYPCVNSSGEYIYIQKPSGNPDGLLYSATNYTYIKTFPSTVTRDGTPGISFNTQESSDLRWDYTGDHPERMYYVNGTSFCAYDVLQETATVLHCFSDEYPAAAKIGNDVEGDSSADSRYWAFIIYNAYDGSVFPIHRIITYDRQTDTILGEISPSLFDIWPSTLPIPNMVEISPLGTKLITHYTRSNYAGSNTEDYLGTYLDAPHAWELDCSTSPIVPIKVSTDSTHSGWAFDENGNELFVSQNSRTDWIEAERIDQDTQFSILAHADVGIGNGFHFSRMTQGTTGWILMTTYKSTTAVEADAWGDNEIVMLEVVDKETRTPRVWRLGHMHNYYNDYYSEGFSPMAIDNTKLWWGARWPFQDYIDTYQMDLPATWVADLQYVEPPAPPVVSSITLQRGVDGYGNSQAFSCFIDPTFSKNANDTSDNPSWRFDYTTLLYFSTSTVPTGITITTATLKMYVTDIFTSTDIACGYIMNPDTSTLWTVNQSTGQTFNTDATWDYKDDDTETDWDTSLSNSFQDVKATTHSITLVSDTGWNEWDVTGIVQQWYAGTLNNQGFWMQEHLSNSSNIKYYSMQHVADPTKRPILYIEYTGGTPTPTPTTGQTIFGIIKRGYNTRGDMWAR